MKVFRSKDTPVASTSRPPNDDEWPANCVHPFSLSMSPYPSQPGCLPRLPIQLPSAQIGDRLQPSGLQSHEIRASGKQAETNRSPGIASRGRGDWSATGSARMRARENLGGAQTRATKRAKDSAGTAVLEKLSLARVRRAKYFPCAGAGGKWPVKGGDTAKERLFGARETGKKKYTESRGEALQSLNP
jgi:hypothetical protein